MVFPICLAQVPKICSPKSEWMLFAVYSTNQDSTGTSMSPSMQAAVLKRFAKQPPEINLLIATAVAEEGMDIRAANVVIRYALYLLPPSAEHHDQPCWLWCTNLQCSPIATRFCVPASTAYRKRTGLVEHSGMLCSPSQVPACMVIVSCRTGR